MDPAASDDPLVRLAEQLERLSQANLALSAAAEDLILHAREERIALREAARGARTAARAAAAASAQTHALADAAIGGDEPRA